MFIVYGIGDEVLLETEDYSDAEDIANVYYTTNGYAKILCTETGTVEEFYDDEDLDSPIYSDDMDYMFEEVGFNPYTGQFDEDL